MNHRADSKKLAVIDVEASGLPPGTFPVEIGITVIETGATKTWLVRPAPEWDSLAWDAAAEALHSISRERLSSEDIAPGSVYAEVAAYSVD